MVEPQIIILGVGGVYFIYKLIRTKSGFDAKLHNHSDLSKLDYNSQQSLFQKIFGVINRLGNHPPDDKYLSKVIEDELSASQFSDYPLFKSKIDEIVGNYKKAEKLNILTDERLTLGLENILQESYQVNKQTETVSLGSYFNEKKFFLGYHKTEAIVRPIFTTAVQYLKTEYSKGNKENLQIMIDKLLYFSRMLADEKNRNQYLDELRNLKISSKSP